MAVLRRARDRIIMAQVLAFDAQRREEGQLIKEDGQKDEKGNGQ